MNSLNNIAIEEHKEESKGSISPEKETIAAAVNEEEMDDFEVAVEKEIMCKKIIRMEEEMERLKNSINHD